MAYDPCVDAPSTLLELFQWVSTWERFNHNPETLKGRVPLVLKDTPPGYDAIVAYAQIQSNVPLLTTESLRQIRACYVLASGRTHKQADAERIENIARVVCKIPQAISDQSSRDEAAARDGLLPFQPLPFHSDHLSDDLFMAANYAIAFLHSAELLKGLHWGVGTTGDRPLHAGCIADSAAFILKFAMRCQRAIHPVSHLLTSVRPNGPFSIGEFSEENAHWTAYRIGIAGQSRLKSCLDPSVRFMTYAEDQPEVATAILENWDSCKEAMTTWEMPDSAKVESAIKWEAFQAEKSRQNDKRIDAGVVQPGDKKSKPQNNLAADQAGDGRVTQDTPEYLVRFEKLKELLVSRAVGGSPDEQEYANLRRELVAIPAIRNALPDFVRRCATIREFWNFIKPMFETEKYRRRTQYLQEEFSPILEALEGGQPLPDLSRPREPAASDRPKPRPDLVLVTVNEHETKAVHDAFLKATGAEEVPVPLEGRLYHNLGTINGTTVYHAISEMGSSGPGAMQQAVDKAIRALDPGAVIAVGIAFGVSEKDQFIGDILLSKQIQLYDLQRHGTKIVLRGDKPHATPRLINHFEALSQVKWKGAKVRPGLILSGEKLIDDKDYRDQLVTLQVEAVGGEMEGAGLYVASADHKVDWIVIKAICDWADGNKKINKKQRQKKAARNAADFIVESLKYAALKRMDQGVQTRP